jgi:hypothetical protein
MYPRCWSGITNCQSGERDQLPIVLNPFQSIAGVFDRARPLLRRPPMVAPFETADQGVSRLQQPNQHVDRIPEETTVAGLMHERSGDGAVEPHNLAGFDFLLFRADKQGAIDRLPGLGPNGADRSVQRRLLRRPRQRQPREGSKRSRVLEMKRQLLIAQLAMLLEKRAAQDRFSRQAFSPGLLDAVAAQILGRQPDEFAMLVQPLRHRLQLAADRVIGKEIE